MLLVLANAAVGVMNYKESQKLPTVVVHNEMPTPARVAATARQFDAHPAATYKIILPNGQTMEGSATTIDRGEIDISAITKLPENAAIIYDLQLQHRKLGAPVNLTVNLDPVTGRATVQGKGFQRYESVQFGNDTVATTVRADWAGVIRSESDWRLDSSGAPSFRLGFFQNTNIARDFNENPLLVKALMLGTANVNCIGRRVSICQNSHRQALLTSIGQIVETWKQMTAQLTTVLMNHTFIMGKFMDAKMQLQTQRLYQEKIAEAHRDYHPSDTMCRVGSFVKSVATTEARATMNKAAFNTTLNQVYENAKNRSSSEGYAQDIKARLLQFRRVYCNPRESDNGLNAMCDHDQRYTSTSVVGDAFPTGIGVPSMSSGLIGIIIPGVPTPPHPYHRMNKDIDYTRTADLPMTLDVDFTDSRLTDDEEDIYALARNLYWADAGTPAPERELAMEKSSRYIDQRSYLAKQNVAHNTFIEIASMKARSNPVFGDNSGWNFMKSMMREFGLTDPEIHAYIGDFPSYHAQMEVLTKKMFQNPDFYTNLYDKPANVERINAALTAVQLMQQRDFLESRQRSEILNSLILEEALTDDFKNANAALTKAAGRVGD